MDKVTEGGEQAAIAAIAAKIAADRARTIEGLKDLLITPEQIEEITGNAAGDGEDPVKLAQLKRWVESGNEAIIARLERLEQSRQQLDPDKVMISPEQLLQVLQAAAEE